MKLNKKTILVTGGVGFIGSNLCDVLITKGIKKLIIFDNLSASKIDNVKHLLDNKKVKLVVGDIRDYDVVEPLIMESDIIFNLACSNIGNSNIRPRVDMETNIGGVFNILQVARKNLKVRIIHASSGSVLGSSDKPMDEEHILNPTTMYAISKMAGEKYCQFFAKEYGVKVSSTRFFHIYGPRQDYEGLAGVVNIFLARIIQGLPPVIWGTGEQVKCFTYVMDAIEAMLLLVENDKTIGEIYNVASDDRITIKKLANLLIKRYADKKIKPKYAKAKVGENMKPFPDTTKIKKIGFKTRWSFTQGLNSSYVWVEEDLNKKDGK